MCPYFSIFINIYHCLSIFINIQYLSIFKFNIYQHLSTCINTYQYLSRNIYIYTFIYHLLFIISASAEKLQFWGIQYPHFKHVLGPRWHTPLGNGLSPQIRKSGGSVDGSVWGPCWWLQKVSCSLLFDFFWSLMISDVKCFRYFHGSLMISYVKCFSIFMDLLWSLMLNVSDIFMDLLWSLMLNVSVFSWISYDLLC